MTEGSFQTLNKTGQEIFSCLVLYYNTAQRDKERFRFLLYNERREQRWSLLNSEGIEQGNNQNGCNPADQVTRGNNIKTVRKDSCRPSRLRAHHWREYRLEEQKQIEQKKKNEQQNGIEQKRCCDQDRVLADCLIHDYRIYCQAGICGSAFDAGSEARGSSPGREQLRDHL